jgi:hypothetical protein
MDYYYTHADKTGHERGNMGKGKPKTKLIYHLIGKSDENGFVSVESKTMFNKVVTECLNLDNLEELTAEEQKKISERA